MQTPPLFGKRTYLQYNHSLSGLEIRIFKMCLFTIYICVFEGTSAGELWDDNSDYECERLKVDRCDGKQLPLARQS